VRDANLTTIHLVMLLGMRGAIPPVMNRNKLEAYSWRAWIGKFVILSLRQWLWMCV